jgi:hypothetical protein
MDHWYQGSFHSAPNTGTLPSDYRNQYRVKTQWGSTALMHQYKNLHLFAPANDSDFSPSLSWWKYVNRIPYVDYKLKLRFKVDKVAQEAVSEEQPVGYQDYIAITDIANLPKSGHSDPRVLRVGISVRTCGNSTLDNDSSWERKSTGANFSRTDIKEIEEVDDNNIPLYEGVEPGPSKMPPQWADLPYDDMQKLSLACERSDVTIQDISDYSSESTYSSLNGKFMGKCLCNDESITSFGSACPGCRHEKSWNITIDNITKTRYEGWFDAEIILPVTSQASQWTEDQWNHAAEIMLFINDGYVMDIFDPVSELDKFTRLSITDVQYLPMYHVDADIRTPQSLENSKAGLFYYWDKTQHEQQYQDTSGPTAIQIYLYPRYYDIQNNSMFTGGLKHLDDLLTDSIYITDLDWGDGQTNYLSDLHKLGLNEFLYHSYEVSGIYTITGFMICIANTAGFLSNKIKFHAVINIAEGDSELDFEYLGSDGFTFIPYFNTTPVISGLSESSLYSKVISRELGYIDSDQPLYNADFKNITDELHTQRAHALITDSIGEGSILNSFSRDYYDNSVSKVLPGYLDYGSPYGGSDYDNALNLDDAEGIEGDQIFDFTYNYGEMGKPLGYTDFGQIRVFNAPMQMWQLLGFSDSEAGNPDSEKHYLNIIPLGYGSLDIIDYYYPVLPELNLINEMDESLGYQLDSQGNEKIPFGSPSRQWNEDDILAYITSETIDDPNLIIDIGMIGLEGNALSDNASMQNTGIMTADYKVEFDDKTFEPSREQDFFTPEIRTDNKGKAY